MSNEKYDTAAAGLTLAAIDGAQMMIESLRKDRDYLSHKLDAARQEIASLRAQLATVSVGGVGSLVSVPPECPHLIWYADQDRKPEMFVGHGARDTAMKRFHMISQHWNANIFVRIKKSSRDCPYPVADLAPAPASQLAAEPACVEPVELLKFAVWDDGELRLLSGRKGPAFDCELYAMPDGKRAPDLFTAAQVQAMLAGAPTPPLTHIGDKP